jgi:glycine cleavage system H protein
MDEEKRNKLGTTHEPVFPKGETPCIWMLAGVLTCWLCDRNLECENCPLDAALRHEAERKSAPDAVNPRRLSMQAPALVSPKDPAEERSPSATGPSLEELLTADLDTLAAEGMYARDHMWAQATEDGLVRVGLDPFAARVVGRMRCVVLAPVGTRLRKGHPCAWLDLPGGTLTLLAPVSGQVLQCNEDLARRTDVEVRDPFGSEWLLLLQPFRIRTESRELMRAQHFAPLVQQDFTAWQREVQQALQNDATPLGQTLADGGRSVHSLAELLGPRGVHRLASRFLSPRCGSRPKDKKSR